ncbi:hypothetical protein OKA05_01325 [Luteolibacter arcticus]|uniref:Lysozyme inhibitor LprI N-terminal domain-containing protein n=1 Tax=Luteolibacter arcticus TaxID=1581411 RepID=A0ABT3GC32_9BACT|nr:hypothetical protein [Luteolibacter arcticus]MCW1921172.1 hypothetical protein [Luteolibacter arcticus]
MKPLSILLLISFAAILSATEHPADEAKIAFAEASSEIEKAEKEFLASVQLIDNDKKRAEVLDLFRQRKEAWGSSMKADANLKIAASPAPSTNTSVGLIPLWSDARHLRDQAKLLREQAKWIKQNWSAEEADTRPGNQSEPAAN